MQGRAYERHQRPFRVAGGAVVDYYRVLKQGFYMPKKEVRLCQLLSPGNIAGRSSSITNAFFNAIIPVKSPTEEEGMKALEILYMQTTSTWIILYGDYRCKTACSPFHTG